MNEKYFTERLFWLPDTDNLLYVSFHHGHGWHGSEICGPYSLPCAYRFAKTYAQLMLHFAHRSPELLLQEEW